MHASLSAVSDKLFERERTISERKHPHSIRTQPHTRTYANYLEVLQY